MSTPTSEIQRCLQHGDCRVFALRGVPATVQTATNPLFFRGFPILASCIPDPPQQMQLAAMLAPANLHLTGGVRNAVAQYGMRFQLDGEVLDLVFCPDCFWLFMHWRGQRVQRELVLAANRPLKDLLAALLLDGETFPARRPCE